MLTLVQSFPSDFRVLNTERLASGASPSRHSVQVVSSLPDPGLWHHLDTEGRKRYGLLSPRVPALRRGFQEEGQV